jgi:hypothetical protein
VELLVEELRREFPGVDVSYIGLLPQHVEKCCLEKEHMQSEDVVTMHNSRRDFDRMVKEKLGDQVDYVEWYELLGFEAEPGLRDIKELKIVSLTYHLLITHWMEYT